MTTFRTVTPRMSSDCSCSGNRSDSFAPWRSRCTISRKFSLGRLQHAHVCGGAVGDDDRYGVDGEQIAERLEEIGLLERGEMGDLVVAEDLDAAGVDEVEVPYERRDTGAVAPKLGCAAGLSADPGEPELVAIVVIQLRDADLQHAAARR